ncbi:MAG TPA: sugar ABC transporter permease [Acidimicrobiia bacterium]|nr:sugar ABC transporter permease [Acidimicrobiia bacterium]
MATEGVQVVRTVAADRPRHAATIRNMGPRRWFREIGWRHVLLSASVVFVLFPLAWMVSASFNAVDNLSASTLIPSEVTLDNFTGLFENPSVPVGRWMWNTLKVSLVAGFLNVFLAALAAYAFSRLRFRGRRVGLLSLLLLQVFPQFLGFIALFLLAQQVGSVFPSFGLNTHAFLILVYMGGAIGFNAFLIKGFMDTIPVSLDESAHVDGASPFAIFTRIVLPLSRPVLAVIFMLSFIGLYSEYILAAFLLTDTAQYTLAVGLQLFVESEYAAKWGALAAAAVIGSLPIVVVFLFAQKHIISGLTQGAVKG